MADIKSELFEHRFWLRIMLEHLFIIRDALSYIEQEEINAAYSLIGVYNDLLTRVWEPLDNEKLARLNQEAYNVTQELRKYKLHLLKRQLTGTIAFALSSGLTSRLINEAEYYLDILAVFLQKKSYLVQPVPLHLLWLIDAAGHAEIIANGLNYSNTDLINRTRMYQQEFIALYVRAAEMKGFFRIGVDNIPSFDQFNEDVNIRLTDFTEFFVDLNNKIIGDKVPSTVTPITLDHMYREECYYLTELAKISKISPPICDPTVQGFELPKRKV